MIAPPTVRAAALIAAAVIASVVGDFWPVRIIVLPRQGIALASNVPEIEDLGLAADDIRAVQPIEHVDRSSGVLPDPAVRDALDG